MKPPRKKTAGEVASAATCSDWRPIATAPKDQVVLVNDTTGTAPWAAAKWCETEEWHGWIYDDEAAADCMPLGPMPTHWMIPPSLPNAEVRHGGKDADLD